MARKRVTVTRESDSGRNEKFKDNYNGNTMTRQQFVNKINNGEYTNYYVRKINGVDTPCSKPDGSTNNNLG